MLVEPLEKYLKKNTEKYNQVRSVISEGIIAGGAARQIFVGEEFGSTDIDFYFPNWGIEDAWNNNLYIQGYRQYHNSQKAIGYDNIFGTKCQLVKKYSEDPQEIVNSFDLTCCMFAIKADQIYYTEEAAEHSLKKIMVFSKYEKANDPYRRVGKYLKKGFVPSCHHSQDILQEFLKYIEEEYQIYDPLIQVHPIGRYDPIPIDNPFGLQNYRTLRPEELEERVEEVFVAFFGYNTEDY